MDAVSGTKLDLEVMLTTRLEADRLRLPPYPAIAFKLQQLARDGRYSSREVCATINADAALVAAVLRRANAAAAVGAVRITSLEGAVARLGIDDLLHLALAQSAGVTACSAGPLASLRRDIWRASLLAGRIALELAERRGISHDEAFVAGLLHDFGAITVVVGLEDLKVELPVLPAERWRVLVDRLHVRFGSVIATRWKLPVSIAHAIEHHHAVAAYRGPHRALVELVATIDHIIAVFDRSPETSIAGLLEVPGLTADERYRIGAMIPKIAEFMASFEASASPHEAMHSAVAPAADALEGSWPLECVVTTKHDTYMACAIAPNVIGFRGGTALPPNWLVQLRIEAEPAIDMLVNIKTCTPHPEGGFVIAAQPFGLDGKDKQAWLALLARTKPDRRLSTGDSILVTWRPNTTEAVTAARFRTR